MAEAEDVRRLALGLPQVEEIDSDGFDFRVGGKGFVCTTPVYDGWPLVMVRLAKVGIERLTELVTDTWRMRAPAGLARELGPTSGLPSGEPG